MAWQEGVARGVKCRRCVWLHLAVERVAGSRRGSSAVCLGGGSAFCMLRVIMSTCALLDGSSCSHILVSHDCCALSVQCSPPSLKTAEY